jgi:hypothetical protein
MEVDRGMDLSVVLLRLRPQRLEQARPLLHLQSWRLRRLACDQSSGSLHDLM